VTLVKAIVSAALFAVVFAEGTRIELGDFRVLYRRPAALLRGVLAVIVVVPVIALAVVRVVRPSFPVMVALALLAASPLAPIVLRRATHSGEDFRVAATMHISLALLSVVSTPLAIGLLAPRLGFAAVAPPSAIAALVAKSMLVPFGLGVLLRTFAARAADRARPILGAVGLAVIAAVVLAIAIQARRLFLAFGVRDYLAMILFCGLTLVSGHLLAARERERTTFALESAARNPGLALLIATMTFGHVAGAVLLPYLVVFGASSMLYVRLRKRTLHRHAPGRMSIA
jgi:BASS family bile acid:Na+ symporter